MRPPRRAILAGPLLLGGHEGRPLLPTSRYTVNVSDAERRESSGITGALLCETDVWLRWRWGGIQNKKGIYVCPLTARVTLLAPLQLLHEAGEYFSLEVMQEREPQVYHHHVGQHLERRELEKQAREKALDDARAMRQQQAVMQQLSRMQKMRLRDKDENGQVLSEHESDDDEDDNGGRQEAAEMDVDKAPPLRGAAIKGIKISGPRPIVVSRPRNECNVPLTSVTSGESEIRARGADQRSVAAGCSNEPPADHRKRSGILLTSADRSACRGNEALAGDQPGDQDEMEGHRIEFLKVRRDRRCFAS